MISTDKTIEGEVVTGIAATHSECWIQAGPFKHPHFNLSSVFSLLAEKGVNVDIITQSEQEKGLFFSFTVAENDEKLACEVLKETYSGLNVISRHDVSKISIVGVGMRTHAGVAARMFHTLAKEKIEILLVTTSEIKIGCLILREHVQKAVNLLHDEFIQDEK